MPRDVVTLLTNAFRPDPRALSQARGLAESGFRVTLVSWDREGAFPAAESRDGFDVIRVQEVRSTYAAGWRQMFRLPRFWRRAVGIARQLEPAIFQARDLDTLPAGWWLKSRVGGKLVYDAAEHYPALMSLYLPRVMVKALVLLERALIRKADVVLTASTVLRDEYLARGIRPVVALGNYPDLSPYARVTEAQAEGLRSELRLAPEDLLVVYVGGFSRNRELLPLIQAAALLPEVQVHLWGDGPQRLAVEQAVAQQPNAYYHGWLASADLPLYFKAADIIYYCLRLDYPGAVYNAPNTLTQAMAASRPIVANDVGDLGRMVRATQCGVLIDQATPQAIAEAVEQLRDPTVRAQLGANGIQAATGLYNMDVTRRQLVEIYQELFKQEPDLCIS